ncbi:hypothetical protein [Leucobacter massiliensis]|uniref:Uncharacterized protein n=1 Tax=Leucobacter massiliensis TaxID=1686285 RepID=A0A2S9QQP4_9MICO|nr:hypothetical protein [Leucobacter massiliensis]PRI11911.1 hypothetical protein B4915_02205 [Leucobacter massiliensis]
MTEMPSAADIEGWVASMRQELAIGAPAPGGVRTPDQILHELERVDGVAAQAIRVVKEADKVRAATSEALVLARAKTTGRVQGATAAERAAALDLEIAEERVANAAAQIAYRYAKDLADLVDSRKSSLQTQAKLVLATYQLAGLPRRG